MKKILLVLASLCVGILPMMADDNFTLLHDITSISCKDSHNNEWDGGYYTQNSTVKIGYKSDNPNIRSVRVAIEKCNGVVRADNSYRYLQDAVQENSSEIAISNITGDETAEFDVSIPGRYCMAYCAIDENGKPLFAKSIKFDSLYDDGEWVAVGEAELSSGVLSSENIMAHTFISNGKGFLEVPGYDIWWDCPVLYPYYSGESWSAPIEYHNALKMYRIVNPFTCNPQFEDFIPSDDNLLWKYYDNVEYTPEAFIFDRQHPAWFLLNAEYKTYTYCEPMRTGIITMHRENPYCYMAHPYDENIGFVKYNVCPIQNIKKTGKYVDMPLDDERGASLIVKFNGWTTGVNEVLSEDNTIRVYYDTGTIYTEGLLGESTLHVIDLSGKIVYTGRTENGACHVSALANGIYFISVANDTNLCKTQKIIIK